MSRLTLSIAFAAVLLSTAASCGGDDSSPPADGGGTDGTIRLDGSGSTDGGGDTDATMCLPAGMGPCATSGAAPCCEGSMCCAGIPLPDDGQCFAGGACPVSDRNVKHGFATVDPEEILDGVASLPISSWSYDFEPGDVRHIGPMAQDFHATFRVGADDRMIPVIDSGGVSLAAIQALRARTEALRDDNDALRRENDALRARLDRIEQRLHDGG
jgi:hypothetical protein